MRMFLLAAAVYAVSGFSAAYAAEPATLSHVKVLSDKVEDVSSLEAIEASIFKPNMTDAQKALAMWETCVKFRHHDSIPYEHLTASPAVYDAIKIFNVYGYCSGLSAQPTFLQLARHAGYPARHWSIFRFGVPEISYNNAWHMYDPGMINYFVKPDGEVASVDEIIKAVKEWHEKNPGHHDNANKLKAYMKDPGIKAGPPLIASCPTLQPNGAYPLNYFGWYSTMLIYNVEKPAFVYEEPYSEGHKINNQLRRGERLTFNWGNRGLHVGMLDEPRKDPESLKAEVGQKALYYTPKYGDLANQRVGNGTLEYNPPLESLKDCAITFDNFAVSKTSIRPEAAGKPATLILDMPCSYVYLGGTLTLDATVPDGSSLAVQVSTNNGLDWKDLGTTPVPAGTIDLQKAIFKKYGYRLKFTLSGNASIAGIKITHDFQHSQRALPALDKGENTISFSAGPNEGTVSIEPAPPKYKDKQHTAADYRAVLSNMAENDLGQFAPSASKDPSVTYPVETPGPMTRIRMGGMYKAQDASAAWLYQVSFDGGKTFTTMHQTKDHGRFEYAWISYDKIPANTRSALVRYAAQGPGNSPLLYHGRIDVDYQHVNSKPGDFAPVNVTYTWMEGADEKKDVHTAKSAKETWKINCAAKPKLKSLVLERQ